MGPNRTTHWQEALSSHKEVVMKLRLFTLSALAAGLLLGSAAQAQEKMSLYSRFPPQLSLIRHALNWARSCGLNLACPVLVSSPVTPVIT